MANPQSNVYSAEGSLIEKVEPLLSRFGLKNNFPCIWSKRSVQSINGSTRTFLEKRDTSFISEYNSTGATGEPEYWANWNEEYIIVAPTPNSGYTVQINYIKDPPHFTSTNTTYLSINQEQLLLYGVLVEAYGFLKGPTDLYSVYSKRYDESMQAFAVQQMGRRRRAEFDDGVPRLKVESPSP